MKETPPDIIDDFTLVAPPDPYAWVWPTAIVLGLLLIGLIVWRLYRKKKLPFQEHILPPQTLAKEGLEASRRLLDEGRYKEFVNEVSRVLRVYIEGRFSLRAPHLSTEEFLFEAERNDVLTDDWQKLLGDFLFECDRVKFALANTEQPRMEKLYSTAESFITQTSKEGGHSCPPAATGKEGGHSCPPAATGIQSTGTPPPRPSPNSVSDNHGGCCSCRSSSGGCGARDGRGNPLPSCTPPPACSRNLASHEREHRARFC